MFRKVRAAIDEDCDPVCTDEYVALARTLRELKREGLAILLSEQNLKSSLKLIDRAYIIDNGRIRYHGTVQELRDNEEIRLLHLMI